MGDDMHFCANLECKSRVTGFLIFGTKNVSSKTHRGKWDFVCLVGLHWFRVLKQKELYWLRYNSRCLGLILIGFCICGPCSSFRMVFFFFFLQFVRGHRGSRVSSGSIVSDYGLDDRAIGVRSQAGAENFSSILCVQIGSGAHRASCTMGTGGPFPGGKIAAGAWCWPPTPI
jgi:hypothetical protein